MTIVVKRRSWDLSKQIPPPSFDVHKHNGDDEPEDNFCVYD
jgi:hypothetical protein